MRRGGSQRDYAKSMALLIYRKEKINQLAGKANRSDNYTYSEFREDLENIRSKSWKEREVQQFLDNYSAQEAANVVGMIRRSTLEDIKSGKASEMSYISFLPSVLTTFVLYYLISALAVEGNRWVNESFTPVKRPDEKGEKSTDEENKESEGAESE